jgi:hypothetical protein
MLITSGSGQAAGAGLWVQLQQQQAQRAADQAELQARSLQAQARDAQTVAEQAKENARSLSVRADQASSEASSAALGLVQSRSLAKTQGQLTDLQQQVKSALVSLSGTSASAGSAKPVLNAEGQTTGAVINIKA